MTKRKCIALLFLFGIVAAAISLHGFLRQREPKYQGKTLTAWLKVGGHGEGLEDKPAIEAVRKMGTNAIPFLLDMVRAKDSRFKLKLTDWTYGHVPYVSHCMSEQRMLNVRVRLAARCK
ncbi:MAG: hypothetical protein HY298_08530 [Verrucomicrobia bacterium]|nr:hypothetical protein [Verrucomicrobiota bacterium]